jgi:hypothetical protein
MLGVRALTIPQVANLRERVSVVIWVVFLADFCWRGFFVNQKVYYGMPLTAIEGHYQSQADAHPPTYLVTDILPQLFRLVKWDA